MGHVSVDLWVFGYKNKTFVFANDVEQVFYVPDIAKNWSGVENVVEDEEYN
jgi:hypothetical protein